MSNTETLQQGETQGIKSFLNQNFDILNNLVSFPENEDEMILSHLANNIAQFQGEDKMEFYTNGESEKIFGFSYNPTEESYVIETNDDKKYVAKGDINAPTLLKLLQDNLATSTHFDVNKKGDKAAVLAAQIVAQAKLAAENYKLLKTHYPNNDFDKFQSDLEEVKTLREIIRLKKIREEVKVKTNTKLESFAMETNLELLRNADPTNQVEAALLWVAINLAPEMDFNSLKNLEKIFHTDNIEENKIAISNGRISVPYKSEKSDDNIPYDLATYLYGDTGLNTAIDALEDTTNTVSGNRGKKVAELLKQGAEIYNKMVGNVESYDSNEVFQQNYPLLNKIQHIKENFWNSEVELETLDNLPPFLQNSDEKWYFLNTNGEFYARTMNLIEEDSYYMFDENAENGWKQLPQSPEIRLAIPEMYKKTKDGYKANIEAVKTAQRLGLDQRAVAARTLNVMYEENKLNDSFMQALITEHTFSLPFPKLDNLEIEFTKKGIADSISIMEAYIYRSYVEYLPGIKPAAAKKLSTKIAHMVLNTIKNNAKDNHGNPLNNKDKYIINSPILEDFSMILNPEHFGVKFNIEKQLSSRTQEILAEITTWKDKMRNLIVGYAGAGGGFLQEIVSGLFDSTLDESWEDIEQIAEEWESMEIEKGGKLTLKEVLIALSTKTITKSLKGEDPFPKESFFGRLFNRGTKLDKSQKDLTKPRLGLDLSEMSQLQSLGENLKRTLIRRITDPKGEQLINDEELITILQELQKKFKNRPFNMNTDYKDLLFTLLKNKGETEELNYIKNKRKKQKAKKEKREKPVKRESQKEQSKYTRVATIESNTTYEHDIELTENYTVPNGKKITTSNISLSNYQNITINNNKYSIEKINEVNAIITKDGIQAGTIIPKGTILDKDTRLIDA